MRKGNEADFDPSKLMSGEWAVSLDAGIVRICLEAGKVIRMATYEAFEEDMKQIEAILLECQSIEEAVRRINTEVSEKLNACAEYVQQAKNYSEQAKTSEANAKSYMQSAKTSEANAKVSETNAKASENSAKEYENSAKLTEERAREVFESIPEDYITLSDDFYALAIKETATGYEIHITDSADMKLREFALYGKAEQNTTSGKNLLESTATTQTINGVTFTVNEDKSIKVSGKATANTNYMICNVIEDATQYNGKYISGCNGGSSDTYFLRISDTEVASSNNFNGDTKIQNLTNTKYVQVYISIKNGITIDTTFYPMISDNGGEYEKYTGGATPRPDFPQPIEVSGESYNLLENTATSQTVNGVTFTVNDDGSVTVNGTATEKAYINIIGEYSNRVQNETLKTEITLSGGYNSDCHVIAYPFINGEYNASYALQSNGSDVTKDWTNVEQYYVDIVVNKGATIENATLYPMIRKASVKNDRYMPYGKGSVEVKSCGKNLLKNTTTSRTVNGITYTINESDGSITANGTATSLSTITAGSITSDKNQDIVLSGCPSGGANDRYGFQMYNFTTNKYGATDYGNGVFSKLEPNNVYKPLFYIRSGITVENITFKPMIRLATDTDGTYQPYKETLATIPTENGLAGIKVSSNGNYTDSNGQQWICDEIVKNADGSGKKVKRFNYIKVTSIQGGHKNYKGDTVIGYVTYDAKPTSNAIVGNVLCNRCVNVSANEQFSKSLNCIAISEGGRVDLSIVGCASSNELRTYISENDVYILYELAKPIETPLTAEEIAEIEKLHTFYPVTNISNDFDCGMSVTYYADSKNYIGNQLAIMKQEQEEAMTNMLLLMPTEVQAMMIENDTNDLLKESEI